MSPARGSRKSLPGAPHASPPALPGPAWAVIHAGVGWARARLAGGAAAGRPGRPSTPHLGSAGPVGSGRAEPWPGAHGPWCDSNPRPVALLARAQESQEKDWAAGCCGTGGLGVARAKPVGRVCGPSWGQRPPPRPSSRVLETKAVCLLQAVRTMAPEFYPPHPLPPPPPRAGRGPSSLNCPIPSQAAALLLGTEGSALTTGRGQALLACPRRDPFGMRQVATGGPRGASANPGHRFLSTYLFKHLCGTDCMSGTKQPANN